jgi:hypothetical protein
MLRFATGIISAPALGIDWSCEASTDCAMLKRIIEGPGQELLARAGAARRDEEETWLERESDCVGSTKTNGS